MVSRIAVARHLWQRHPMVVAAMLIGLSGTVEASQLLISGQYVMAAQLGFIFLMGWLWSSLCAR